jgi:hypothetical protein
MAVGVTDIREAPVFEQLVAVAEFEVSEAFPKVIFQGVEEQALVFGEIVRPTVVAAMTVAEEDEPGLVVEGDFVGRLKDLAETGGYRHGFSPFFVS